MKSLVLLLALSATSAAFADSARTATIADQKRESSSEMSGVIDDVERSLAELRASSAPVSESAFYDVRVALQPARERWAAVNAADARHFDRVKDDARTALFALEPSYYVLVSSITSERRVQETRVASALVALEPLADDLRVRAAQTRGSAARRLTAAADRLASDAWTLSDEAARLPSLAGEAWADRRRWIEADIVKARDRYWAARRRAS